MASNETGVGKTAKMHICHHRYIFETMHVLQRRSNLQTRPNLDFLRRYAQYFLVRDLQHTACTVQ